MVLNYDDGLARRSVEFCVRTGKMLLNPIIDWDEEDVWEFLNGNCIKHCSLYDEGFTRLGCIGCPMSGTKRQKQDFLRWPKFRELYIRAFDRMIAARKEAGLSCGWEDGEDVMCWWLREEDKDGGKSE